MPPVAKGPVRAEPRSPDMTFLVSKYHDGAALHPTAKEVLKALRKDGYLWPNMAKDVANMCNLATSVNGLKINSSIYTVHSIPYQLVE